MGYAGNTFRLPCNKGGLNHSKNTDMIPSEMMVSPSRNINLHEDGRGKRGGTAKVNSTAITGAPRLMGGFDFQLTSTSYQVVGGKDGKLYKNSTTTIKTGMSTQNKYSFEVFGNELYVCDGDTVPQTWDGSAASTSDLTTPSGDWTGANQPFQMIAHGKGASRRMWALYGNTVYYSTLSNGKEFTGGTSGTIVIDTGDAFGLVGGVEFQDRLIVFSRNRAFIIEDSDTDKSNWGYSQAAWTGGAASWRTIVKTPNDLVVMDEGGNVYSVTAAQEYGDYKMASIARPAYMDNYIRENIRLSYINDFHGVYDPELRAVKFFVVRNGQTEIDTALVYFIDRPAPEAWVVHDNQSNPSGYDASCAFPVRVSAGTYSIYTGDYSGYVWKLEQATRSDDSKAYYGGFKTVNLAFDNPRLRKLFKRGFVVAKTQGDYNLQVSIWVDGEVKANASVSMAGEGGVLGSFVLDTDVLGGAEFLDRVFPIGCMGRRLQLEFYNSSAGQDFFISQILLDFKMLGAAPSGDA